MRLGSYSLADMKTPKEEIEGSYFVEAWLENHVSRKAKILETAFNGDKEQADIAKFELRLAYGLATDPDLYGALVDWAHGNVVNFTSDEKNELIRQGFVDEGGFSPSLMAYELLGINTENLDNTRELVA